MSFVRIEYEISKHGARPKSVEVTGGGSSLKDSFETALDNLSDEAVMSILRAAQSVLGQRDIE